MTTRDLILLSLRVVWGVGLLAVSGAGLRKARSGAAGTAPLIASLGPPFDRSPEVWAGAAMSAELVIPFFIVFGFMTRFAACVGALHFAVASYAHLVPWQQPFEAIVFSKTDPSGVGSIWWMIACVAIAWLGPGLYSLDKRIEDGPGASYTENANKKKSE